MSTTLAAPAITQPRHDAIPAWLTLLLATACGMIAANIYYSQPLAGPISAALGISPTAAGLVVTMTQIGYGIGLLAIVPLGDLIENRRLVFILLAIAAAADLGAALSAQPLPFLTAALFTGLSSVAAQILVPYAAHLAPEQTRGRVVGNVTSGLMLGIMLSRPISGAITHIASWHTVFFMSAASMLLLAITLRRVLPTRVPTSGLRYTTLLASMGRLALTTPLLRRRAFYQAGLFGAFSLFWTTVPLLLASPTFGFSQAGIALFAFAGVAGAVSSPIAGRLADRGWTRPATALAMLSAAAAFLLMQLSHDGSHLELALLVASAILLDMGVSANLTLGQRAIFALPAEYRARLNGLYMAIFFIGGAFGSATGGWAYAHGGWSLTCWIGLALPVAAFAYFLTEKR